MLGVLSVQAADREIELTPLIGVRGGATLDPQFIEDGRAKADATESYGLLLDFRVKPTAKVEIFADRQRLTFENSEISGADRFDLTVDYLQAGSTYEPRRKRHRPFVGFALGLVRFGSDSASIRDSVGLSASLGGGLKVPLKDRLALRLELRYYGTISDASVFASCGPGCSVELDSDGWSQFAGRIGLAIKL